MGLADEFVPGVTAAVLLLALVGFVGYVALTGPVLDESLDTAEVERLVVEETNEVREEHGAPHVGMNASLREAARDHAADMSRHGYVGHDTPDGEAPVSRYGWCADGGGYFGENVANTWHDRNIVYDEADVPTLHLSDEREVAEHLVRKWMDSEGHRDTLLNDAWSRIGVGVAVGDDNEVFATQAFCSGPLNE